MSGPKSVAKKICTVKLSRVISVATTYYILDIHSSKILIVVIKSRLGNWNEPVLQSEVSLVIFGRRWGVGRFEVRF